MNRHDDDVREDPFEDVLRQELHLTMSRPVHAPDELERLRPRFVRAQRRRTAITGMVAAVAIALFLVGVGSLTRERSRVVTPAGHTRTLSPRPVSSTTVPPLASSVVPVVPPTTPSPVGSDARTRAPWAAPDNVVTPPPGSTQSTVATSPIGPTQSAVATSPIGPATTVAPNPSTMVPPASRTVPLTAPGGTVVVRVDGATVSLVSITPAPGWNDTEVRTDGGRVEVRFGRIGTSDQSRIEARVDNGQLRTLTE